ncbi:hypothetical protein J4421_01010 [Candidatus Woesearchaeota archaeon]|nr:hypothetical protein [Candidatus Woesearchaeota archaeon]
MLKPKEDLIHTVFLLSLTTLFGIETMEKYRRVRRIIAEGGESKLQHFISEHRTSYCGRRGLELATKEVGLEHLLSLKK